MRPNWMLIALGMALSFVAFAMPAGADEGDGDGTTEPKIKCKSEWAFTECNAGYATCTVLGTACFWCDTPKDSKVKNCRSHDTTSTCTVQPNGQPYAVCGDKKTGVCINDTTGGMKCQDIYYADCGKLKDFCQ